MIKNEKGRKKDTVTLGEEIGEYLSRLKVETKFPDATLGSIGTRSAAGKRTTKAMYKKAAQNTLNLLVVWQRIAPTRMQEHTDNIVYSTRSQNTEILVYVDSPAYAAELTMDKELYRLRIEQETGKKLADIKFLVSRKVAFRKKK